VVSYLTYGTDAANLLFHVVNDRHRKKRAMVFTTNKPLAGWGHVLHDEDLAHAIVDRILERGRMLILDGPSMRTRHLGLDDPTANPASTQAASLSGEGASSGIQRPEFPEPTRRRGRGRTPSGRLAFRRGAALPLPALTPSAVDRLGPAIRDLGEVRLAFLFGSRARGRARPDSDFDIAVLLDPAAARADRGSTVRRLAGRLGCLVSSALVDLVILNDAPALLRHRVLRDGILLFERSGEDRVRFAAKTLRDYQDHQVRRERATRERIRRLRLEANDGRPRDLLEKARGAARLLDKAARVR
jgi:predicted nucleotidyltransferase